jgi:hypothetical protein
MKFIHYLSLSMLLVVFAGCDKSDDDPEPTAHTLTFQPGPAQGQDTHVSKIDNVPADGGNNLNFTGELVMARWVPSSSPNNATWRSFIKFDLDTIPANADITSAKLYLYGRNSSIVFPSGNSGDNTSLIQRVTGANWDQATLTYNNMPASTDVGQAVIPASTSQWNYNVMVDVTTMVKAMVANPATNYGFSIRLATETPSKALIFATSENSDPNLRPKLVIEATY